jgi:hypothetical protein
MKGGPSIKVFEDTPFEVLLSFRLADGRVAEIREKWIEMSPRYIAFYNEWDPGAMTPRHGHTGDHAIFIIEGEIACGDVICRAGTHIMLEWGDTFGPWEAGDQGAKLYGFIAGDGHPFFDLEGWAELLAERGAVELPVAAPSLPLWAAVKGSVLPGPIEDTPGV